MTNQYLSPTHLAKIERQLSSPLGLPEVQIKILLKSAELWREWERRRTVGNVSKFWKCYGGFEE